MDISAKLQEGSFEFPNQVFGIVADEQTHGVGQAQGSHWASPKGNLYVTYVFKLPSSTVQFAFNFPQIAGISVAQTFEVFGINKDVTALKFVNDFFIDDYKVGGVLCKSELQHSCVLQMGIGVNLNVTKDFYHD